MCPRKDLYALIWLDLTTKVRSSSQFSSRTRFLSANNKIPCIISYTKFKHELSYLTRRVRLSDDSVIGGRSGELIVLGRWRVIMLFTVTGVLHHAVLLFVVLIDSVVGMPYSQMPSFVHGHWDERDDGDDNEPVVLHEHHRQLGPVVGLGLTQVLCGHAPELADTSLPLDRTLASGIQAAAAVAGWVATVYTPMRVARVTKPAVRTVASQIKLC